MHMIYFSVGKESHMNKEVTLTNIPLNQFKPGQKLMIKFPIGRGFYVHCPSEFIELVRGLVKVKCLNGWEPTWFDWKRLEDKYPNRIATVRAKNCYVWGKGEGDKWERCHWFKDTKTSCD